MPGLVVGTDPLARVPCGCQASSGKDERDGCLLGEDTHPARLFFYTSARVES